MVKRNGKGREEMNKGCERGRREGGREGGKEGGGDTLVPIGWM
jgi:hypothetical protein